MHILITAKAKLVQLYQCTPLIVGDKYTDAELMTFLGAKLTKDYPEPFGPPTYVLSATPLAVMDALQERGFELKMCHTVEDYITWIMSNSSDKMEEVRSVESHRLHQQQTREQCQREDMCAIKPKEAKLECDACGSKLKGAKAGEGLDVATQTLKSPESDRPKTPKTPSTTKKPKPEGNEEEQSSSGLEKHGKSTSDHAKRRKGSSDREHGSSSDNSPSSKSDSEGSGDEKVGPKPSEVSNSEALKEKKKRERSESKKNKKREPAPSESQQGEIESPEDGTTNIPEGSQRPRANSKRKSKEEEKEAKKAEKAEKAERKSSVKKKKSTQMSDVS